MPELGTWNLELGMGQKIRHRISETGLLVDAPYGKTQLEDGSAAWLAFDTNTPRVLLDDAIRDGETQSCSLSHLLGREKGVINLLDIVLWNSNTIVSDFDHQRGILFISLHFQLSALRHRILSIEEKVHKNLLQLTHTAQGFWNGWIQSHPDLDTPLLELVVEQGERLDHERVHIQLVQFGVGHPRKVQEIIDNVGSSKSLLLDFFQPLMLRTVWRSLLEQHLCVTGDTR